MNTRHEVRYDPVALSALEEAAAYIADRSGHGRASAWLNAMSTSIQDLEANPRTFAVVAARGRRPIRSKRVMSHRIFYIIDDPTATIYIIDVVHTARESRLQLDRDE